MGAASGVRPSVYETQRITKVLAYSQSFQWGCATRYGVKGVGTPAGMTMCVVTVLTLETVHGA